MKIQLAHFAHPVPLCGAYSPRYMDIDAPSTKQYVASMELDTDRGVLWLEVAGAKGDKFKGRYAVPLASVVLMRPAPEDKAKK